MEAISVGSDPNFYFRVGKLKISEGMKCLQDLVQWYTNNLIPENDGILYETVAYLQSLQRQVQEIESLAQQEKVSVSSNISGTVLQRGQGINQIREQNAYFGHNLNQEIEMVMNPNIDNTSSTKRRKLKSKVWEDFTKYEGMDGKEWAKCKHCKKDFVGSSKSGTTHLKNHLRSCSISKNPDGGAEKAKEKSVIDSELNGFDLVIKIIKYGLNSIKNDILDVYKQEKDKLHRYLHKLASRFNVTIESVSGFCLLTSWFIDDDWELKKIISLLGSCEYEDKDDVHEIAKSWLVDWNIDRKLCSMVKVGSCNLLESEEVAENINNLCNGRGSLPSIGNLQSILLLLDEFDYSISLHALTRISRTDISTKASKLWDYVRTSSNVNKFQSAKEKALSIGKTVTSQSVPLSGWFTVDLLEWVMGCKEAFCELEHIDLDFKSINFIKEDWEEATLLYNSWKVLKDLRKDVCDLLDPTTHRTTNEYFPIFFKLVQLGKAENHYYCHVASCFRKCFEKFGDNSLLTLIIAVFLDPRFKMDIVKHFYEEIHYDEIYYDEFYDDLVDIPLKKIIDGVTNIYNRYAEGTINSESSSSSNHGYSNSSGSPSKMLDTMWRSFAFSQFVNDIATPKSELDRYLIDSNCPPPGEEFDILAWWRLNSPIYPTLAKIARDFLSIPISSSLDLDYPLLDDINDIYRCSNLDDNVKLALACTKVWLNSREIQ